MLAALLLLWASGAAADERVVTDMEDNEIPVQVLPAPGPFLVIWLTDLTEPKPAFDDLLGAVNRAGMEVWRVDLLQAYYLNRSRELTRQLSGSGVAALLAAAHEQSDKRILLVGYDRLVLPLLRGVRLWQLQWREASRLAGAVLFYPNPFGPAPAAGVDPILDPVVSATNVPVLVIQPEIGVLRWRLQDVLDGFWRSGTPAFSRVLPGVRDGYLVREAREPLAADARAVAETPELLLDAARLLAAQSPPPTAPIPGMPEIPGGRALGIVPLEPTRPAPDVDSVDARGQPHRLGDYAGKVVLVNFWASWCPPCVDEIPSMNRLASGYAPADFEILSVNFRETPERILGFLDRVKVDFPVLVDPEGRIAEQWKVFSFPSSFLLDRQGRMRYSVNNAIAWDDEDTRRLVDQLIAEPHPAPR